MANWQIDDARRAAQICAARVIGNDGRSAAAAKGGFGDVDIKQRHVARVGHSKCVGDRITRIRASVCAEICCGGFDAANGRAACSGNRRIINRGGGCHWDLG